MLGFYLWNINWYRKCVTEDVDSFATHFYMFVYNIFLFDNRNMCNYLLKYG